MSQELLNFGEVEHTNNFARSLDRSHRASDLPIWEECYIQFFPKMQGMHVHAQDGDHQRTGVDRTVIMSNGKVVSVDEKIREKNRKTGKVYSDIALEEWSDFDRKVAGWVIKELLCDYIAYAILPLGKCYLLPVLQLQQAWLHEGEIWKSMFPRVAAYNEFNGRKWLTVSWGIPVDILFKAIGGCLRARFDNPKDFADDYQ